ncbi:uncharacterized protein [Anabrus simplex]|uniref:uncharacterized protein n=1 Tax=Anabrus simplex TaxID=316456 RepID=UPI0035A33068
MSSVDSVCTTPLVWFLTDNGGVASSTCGQQENNILQDEDEDQFEELQRLVYEESDDVKLAKEVLSKTESSKKSGYRSQQLGGLRGTTSNRDELDTAEEIQPEVAAAIMHTEEQGLPMGSAPSALYAILFAEHQEDSVVPVGSAGPPPHQDLVIPLSAPRLAHHSMDVEDAALLASAVKNTTKRPKDCIFSEHLEKSGDKKGGNAGGGSSGK